MHLYDYLQAHGGYGCTTCPLFKECGDLEGSGYTYMDEYGTCPVPDINTNADLANAKLPE
jgi:hypothetical protein